MVTGHLNAASGGSGLLVNNSSHWRESYSDGSGSSGDWLARSAGTWGNNLKVWVCPSATAYEQLMGTNNLVNQADAAADDTTIVVDDADKASYVIEVDDIISFTSDAAGTTPVAGQKV